MTKTEKANVLNTPSIAYYSGCNGIEIKSIEYGINDYIVFVAGAWYGEKTVHRSKIYYSNTNNDYFRFEGYRIPLNECIRTNAF